MTANPLALPLSHGVAPPRSAWSRRVAWGLLFGAVLLSHALLTLWLQENLVGWGEGDTPMPQRIEVAYVQALAPAAPPAAPAAAARAKPTRPRAVAPAASTPLMAATDPVPEAIPEPAPGPTPIVEAQVSPPPALPEPAAASASTPVPASFAAASAPAASSVPFEWPPSTRLTYVLSGNYRGEVHGSARVQWVRLGSRYQVHLDLIIGPSFAPLISRRMTSDGELSEQGLSPRRYDEATRLPFQSARRVTLQFTPEQVTLASGSQQPAPPGLQDPASQFVQLTWLFTTRPELLRAGNTVTIALALPRRVGSWVYDVLGQERLATPIGDLETFHLKPRLGDRRPGNELSAEVWFAPSLQYLPVRIRIQQDADTFIDLLLDAAPLQAAPPAELSTPR